jgi:hypothetical protein
MHLPRKYKSWFFLPLLAGLLVSAFNFTQASGLGLSIDDHGFTLNPHDVDRQWGLAKAGFPQAWQMSTGTKETIVAVIDTGIDATHVDLGAINFVEGYDFVNRKPILPGANSDDNGHGTLVAGVLGATANNKNGITGTNWQISIIPIKALDSTGKGDVRAISEGIIWAVDHGADLINLSVGGSGFSRDDKLAEAVEYAFAKGVLTIAAAGNDTQNLGHSLDKQPVYPICEDNGKNMILGVTAVDHNDIKPEFANFGKNCIDVAAPGKRILSTINYDPLSKALAPNAYAYVSGSSMAVPFVVGQAALIKAKFPELTNIQIRDRIIKSADPIDNLNLTQCDNSSCVGMLGAGRINVENSLKADLGQIANLKEGELVRNFSGDKIYLIQGGKKKPISKIVLQERFKNPQIMQMSDEALSAYPEGAFLTLPDGAVFKPSWENTVYMMLGGQMRPITAEIFKDRNLEFNQVVEVGREEFDSWLKGPLLPPAEGSLLKSPRKKTIYWVVGGVVHPINLEYYRQTGLNIFPVKIFPDSQIQNFPRGEPMIR